MNRRDQVTGSLAIFLSFLICAEALSQGIGKVRYPGPGFMPFLSGSALGVLGIILVIKSSLGKSLRPSAARLWRGKQWGKVALTIFSLVLYALLLSKLGYLIATFCLTLFLFGIVAGPKLWVRIASALITSVATYAVFYLWLGVQLPRGLFGL